MSISIYLLIIQFEMLRKIFPKILKMKFRYGFSSDKAVGNTNCQVPATNSDMFYGIKPVRRCTQEEMQTIELAYNKLLNEGKLDENHTEINWSNIFMNNQFHVPMDDFWRKFDKTIRDIYWENEKPGTKIYSYGFMVNPLHSQKDQHYHFEYSKRTGVMLIPLTYMTTKNSTQYLNSFVPKSKPKLGVRSFNNFGENDIELLEHQNVDYLEVSQVICRPYTVLKIGCRTIHRGIRNLGGFARPVIYLTFGEHDYTIKEGVNYTFTQNKQRRQKLEQQGTFNEYFRED